VPNDLYVEMHEMAAASGVKIGEFMRALMRFAKDKKAIVRDNPDDKAKWLKAVNDGVNTLPPIRQEIVFVVDEFQQTSLNQILPTSHSPEPQQSTRDGSRIGKLSKQRD